MPSAADLTAASWRVFSDLLDQALELPPTERLGWIEALPAEHETLKPALRAVLARAGGVETAQWLNTLPHTASAAPIVDEADLQPGTLIGPYRLIRELGTGGMGAVWLAERADGSLKRQVALKLPRASWSRGLAERMARERDILAALEHPHIARLYDAGTDAQGRPYLALEYVEGQPIDVYCRERGLNIKQRVQLLLQVAHAVAFAHSRLVIHRDLKPSNILVTADGQVRLLDFGIAKLMEGDRAQETKLTQIAGRALTLDYASPEQIRGEPIGTASDVYSLGVVAYELLTGARPYKLKRGSAAAVEQAILEADAQAASQAASDPALRRQLRGDLDAVLNRALCKDVARRYASVEALADDFDRYIKRAPVRARPDSRFYRLGRFIVRNRVPVAAAFFVAIALSVGAALALWQAKVAQRQAQTAESVQRFILNIFTMNSQRSKDPVAARATTARELLDIGAQSIDEALKDVPEARVRMLGVLGSMYVDLDLHDKAAALDEKRIQILRQGRFDKRKLAAALLDYANALQSTNRRGEIGPVLQEARQLLDEAGDRESKLRGELLVRLSRYHYNKSLVEAIKYADEAAAIFRKYPDEEQFLSTSLIVAARARTQLGEFRSAAANYEASLAILTRMREPPHLDIATARTTLAEHLFIQQRFDEASALARESAESLARAVGNNSPTAIVALARAAQLHHSLGLRREARATLASALEQIVRIRGEDDSLFTAIVRTSAARAYLDEGRIQTASALVDKNADVLRKHYAGSSTLATALILQAATKLAAGRLNEAKSLLDEAESLWLLATAGQARPWRYNPMHILRARLALARNDDDAALESLARFVPLPAEESAQPHPDAVEWRTLKALALLARGDVAQARLEATLAAADADAVTRRGTLPSMQAEAALALGVVLLRMGDSRGALESVDKALAIRRANDVPDSPWIIRTLAFRGLCALRAGDGAAARAALAEAEQAIAKHLALSPWFVAPVQELGKALRSAG
ncbi:MAG: hypothetical protein BroJett031_22820 [Betaproteobacteria bacterium]|nr:MAG: hypothetical protein BroJett031_22820 [Betaproteobacteria bacterium]